MVGLNLKDVPRTKYYICDRKKCKHCTSGCKYTSDIEHAVKKGATRFASFRSGLYEVHE